MNKRGYPLINSREEEIYKGKSGVALGKVSQVFSSSLCNSMGYTSSKRQQTQDKASEIRLQIIKNLLEHMENNHTINELIAQLTGQVENTTENGLLVYEEEQEIPLYRRTEAEEGRKN